MCKILFLIYYLLFILLKKYISEQFYFCIKCPAFVFSKYPWVSKPNMEVGLVCSLEVTLFKILTEKKYFSRSVVAMFDISDIIHLH